MSELAVTLLRLSYLLLLWLFVLAAIGVLRRDIYGTRIVSRRASKSAHKTAARAERLAETVPAQAPVPATTLPGRDTPRQLLIVAGSMAGTTVPLASAPVLIGRAPDCNLVIDDEYASNHHAQLMPDAAGWLLVDLGSTNGTYLGPDRITDPIQIKVGDEFRIGRTTLEVRG